MGTYAEEYLSGIPIVESPTWVPIWKESLYKHPFFSLSYRAYLVLVDYNWMWSYWCDSFSKIFEGAELEGLDAYQILKLKK